MRLLTDRGRAERAAGRGARFGAGVDRRPPGHAVARAQEPVQDAAVVGKVFWAGALAEMGGRDPREVEQALHELARKELVRPARTSSMEGEAEYGFWHVLVRDVCYAQIPRAARAARHLAAAAWIERKAGERVEDLADVLAHHHCTALELSAPPGSRANAHELEAAAAATSPGRRACARARRERAEANLPRRSRSPRGPPGAGEPARALGAGGAAAGPLARGESGARGGDRPLSRAADTSPAGRTLDRAPDRAIPASATRAGRG